MKQKSHETYFILRKSKLMQDFNHLMKRARAAVITQVGETFAETLLAEARQEYAELIPDIPYVGRSPIFVRFITGTAQSLAIYRVFSRHGMTVAEAGKLYYLACKAILNSYPAMARRLIGKMSFANFSLRVLRKRALQSQKWFDPEGYVFIFVEGDGKNFDYGIDYLQCGGCKFLEKQGASELAPYICTADILYSELFATRVVVE
jgi:hypothetical protein